MSSATFTRERTLSNSSMLSTTSTVNKENVQVTVRCRPPSKHEHNSCWNLWEANKVISNDPRLKKQHTFTFDNVFYGSDNKALYNTSIDQLINQAMEGYNATVFAYGQTASGKTFTMMGNEEQPGIIPQSVNNVFAYIKKAVTKEFLLRVSYLEIYNETIRDLLNPSNDNLKIHQDKIRGVYVTPLTEEVVTCPSDVLDIIRRGERNRHISSTDYNLHSSRSHTLFQMVIESRRRTTTSTVTSKRTMTQSAYGQKKPTMEAVKISQLNLIDLAGSEKAATNEDRRKEGSYINKSLLTLGTVISKLTESAGSQHVPFRDSKLTRILQTALTGHAKVRVICTISPSVLEESVNTLKFASRVKKITIHAKNDDVMDDKALIQKYRNEIIELKSKLQSQEQQKHHEEQLAQMAKVRNAMKERIGFLTKLILTSNNVPGQEAEEIEGEDGLVHQLQNQIKRLMKDNRTKDDIIDALQMENKRKQEEMERQAKELSELRFQLSMTKAELHLGPLSPSSTSNTSMSSL